MSASSSRSPRKKSKRPRGARKADNDPDADAERDVVFDRGTYKPCKKCAHCRRLITWRKKWERSWESVKYCSKRCKSAAKQPRRAAAASDDSGGGDDSGPVKE